MEIVGVVAAERSFDPPVWVRGRRRRRSPRRCWQREIRAARAALVEARVSDDAGLVEEARRVHAEIRRQWR